MAYRKSSPATSGSSSSTTATRSAASTPVSSPEQKAPARLSLANVFRRKNTPDGKKKGGRRMGSLLSMNSPRRASTPPPNPEARMEEIIEQVLERYPKTQCESFADHLEFAMAELTTSHSHELHMTRELCAEVKARLKVQLSSRLSTTVKMAERRRRRIPMPPPLLPAESPIFVVKSNAQSDDATSTYYWSRPSVPSNPMDRSSTSLTLPTPSNHGKELEDSGSTETTSLEDEFGEDEATVDSKQETTLPPVHKLLLMDAAGHLGLYTGTIASSGKPHGQGRLVYQTDLGTYEGSWNQGRWEGKGRHTQVNGDVYEGDFIDHLPHGMGVYEYKNDQRRFEGRYVQGERVQGTMSYGDGSLYKGQWYLGKRHGMGRYRFCDKSLYKGEFSHDKIHGFGRLTWPDGSQYVGEWIQGNRHGKGKEYTANGQLRYEGLWKDSKPVDVKAEPRTN